MLAATQVVSSHSALQGERPRQGTGGTPQSHECFMMGRADDRAPKISDPVECAHKTPPASTFKVPHALIALQTGVITPETVVKWDGTARNFETWRRDHTVDSAIKWSVFPFFQHTARLIGRDRMRQSLASLRYAEDSFDGELTEFWNNGDLVVSPAEQFAFLRRFVAGDLPIDRRHLATVRNALRMPPGQITNASGVHAFVLDGPKTAVVRAKTGNTTVKGERVSWLIGTREVDGTETAFVGRVRSTGALDSTAGADVARRGLNASMPGVKPQPR
jgi:beta-lactamase class D